MATPNNYEFDHQDALQGFGDGPFQSGAISDGYGEGKMVLVDARTLDSENPAIVTSNDPVHVSSLGRFGLAVVNTDLLNRK